MTSIPIPTAPWLSLLEGRQVSWESLFEECLTAAGEDPRARLLSVFDALHTWATSPARFRGCTTANAVAELAGDQHPIRNTVLANKQALRARMLDLAKATDVLDPSALVDQLLLVYEGAFTTHTLEMVDHAADRAHEVAHQLVFAAVPHPVA